MSGVVHRTQIKPWSCVHACIAMMTDVDQEDVIRYAFGLGIRGGISTRDNYMLLDKFRLIWNAFVFPEFVANGYYFATVPSLNIEGGNHQVIVFVDDDFIQKIYDPNEGKEGKKFYTINTFSSRSELIYVNRGGGLPLDFESVVNKENDT